MKIIIATDGERVHLEGPFTYRMFGTRLDIMFPAAECPQTVTDHIHEANKEPLLLRVDAFLTSDEKVLDLRNVAEAEAAPKQPAPVRRAPAPKVIEENDGFDDPFAE